MIFKLYPILSQRIQNRQGGNHKLAYYNAIYSIARSIQHPVNNMGSAEGVKGIGCGCVWVELKYLMSLLQISQKKLIRLIYKGADYHFWRDKHIEFTGDGWVKFSLYSPKRIAEFNGFELTGGTISLEEEDLKLKDFVRRTTEFAAYCFQQVTYNAARFYATRSKAETGKRKKLAAPHTIVNAQTSESAGKLRAINKRFVEIDPSTYMHYGVTQEFLAKKLGYSVHTIKQHLSNKWREKQNLSLIEKKQQCILQPELTPKEYYRLIKYIDLIDDTELEANLRKMFVLQGKVYLALNNVYNSEGFVCKQDFAQRLAKQRQRSPLS